MHHLAISAVATVIALGAGAGAVTTIDSPGGQARSDYNNPVVGGQAMLADASIMANASRSPLHTVFVNEMKQTGYAATLEGKGEFTVFAPTDQAYATAPKPAGKSALAKDAAYLIVKGRYDTPALLKAINKSGGRAVLHTLEGGSIVASLNGPTNIALMDEKGHVADIAIYDIHQVNGVMQIIDRVLQPASSHFAAR